ncbi:hypothetical protein PPL_12521 [Heterostelium album PN500]|uniref:Roadblock/LAMTOR2 domain-containing protein n=1 Tax=Heterostelium pallidum (strain ATCC 26659 / Pp 5 / PN500) TaxID=670386 RepID=D3BMU8_HETP5|nr:hypothetical protein PPL_12521 [Heterostelium album PN500]EFA77310.1 hypothetical protein PPL_12521 [Heterostelium album PN500]|eukprot:XP_020429439.1 hypothetical protein PPL_12521 [Heterostelium album PN500]
MTNCSRSNAVIAPKLLKQVQSKLKDIQQLFPTTTNCIIMDKNGEIIVETSGTQTQKEKDKEKDLSMTIHQLKTYAITFGATLQYQDEVQHIHIRGDNHMFSFYVVRDSILAFFTNMDFDTGKDFNFQQADDKVKAICAELLHLLSSTKI